MDYTLEWLVLKGKNDDRPVDGYNSYLGVLLCQAFDPTD